MAIPLEIGLPVVALPGRSSRCCGGCSSRSATSVTATPLALDPQFPDWGDSRYLAVTLAGTVTLPRRT